MLKNGPQITNLVTYVLTSIHRFNSRNVTNNDFHFIAQITANRKNSVKNIKKSNNKNELIEEEDENGFVQVLIKKDHLEELQSILTIHRNSTDISQNEITSLCGILADCGILNNKEN